MPKPTPEPPPNADDPEAFRRFLDMAREVEAAEPDPEALDRVLKKLASSPKHSATWEREGKPRQSRGRKLRL